MPKNQGNTKPLGKQGTSKSTASSSSAAVKGGKPTTQGSSKKPG